MIITVRRGNVLLDVPSEQQSEYLAKGYDVLGPDGKVLIKTIPNDMNSLKKGYSDLQKENAELKKKIEELELVIKSFNQEEPEEPEEVSNEPEDEGWDEMEDSEEPEDEEIVKPKKKGKRK